MKSVETNLLPGANVKAAYQTTTFTYGKPAKIYNKDYLNTFFKDTGFKPETGKALNEFFQSQKNYEIYGSTPTKAQLQNYRTPKDLDVVFNEQSGAVKAKEIAGVINKFEGPGVAATNEGQILVRGIKKFDIHGFDNPAEFSIVNQPFGFNKLPSRKVSGIPTSQLSQEGVNKLSSVGSLQPEGFVGPNMVRRGKDIADFYVIQKELIEVLGRKGSITAATQNTLYMESAINYFGQDLLTKDYPKLLGYSSPNYNAPSPGAFFISLPSVSSIPSYSSSSPAKSPNSSIPSSLSFSKSRSASSYPSPSPSRSPNSSPSPSPKPSPSMFSLSPSPSPSRSPSPVFSFGRSPRPSGYSSPSPSSVPIISFINPKNFPKFDLDGFGDRSKSRDFGAKRTTGYIPSPGALLFGIRGKYKPNKLLVAAGLDFRPIDKKRFKAGGLRLRKL